MAMAATAAAQCAREGDVPSMAREAQHNEELEQQHQAKRKADADTAEPASKRAAGESEQFIAL